MEDGAAGSPLREAADAAEERARPGATLRPFAPFSGAAEADEGGGDWSFIDCAMEEVDLQDLPSATIACHLDPRVFVDGLCRVHGVWACICSQNAACYEPKCCSIKQVWSSSRRIWTQGWKKTVSVQKPPALDRLPCTSPSHIHTTWFPGLCTWGKQLPLFPGSPFHLYLALK